MSSYDDEDNVSIVKAGLLGIGGIVAIMGLAGLGVGLGWCGEANNLAMHKVFDPQYEAVRRETFEQSKSYNQGMIQELQNMQFEYVQADSEHKAGLASIILHRSADYDVKKLPPDLAQFISDLRSQHMQMRAPDAR